MPGDWRPSTHGVALPKIVSLLGRSDYYSERCVRGTSGEGSHTMCIGIQERVRGEKKHYSSNTEMPVSS